MPSPLPLGFIAQEEMWQRHRFHMPIAEGHVQFPGVPSACCLTILFQKPSGIRAREVSRNKRIFATNHPISEEELPVRGGNERIAHGVHVARVDDRRLWNMPPRSRVGRTNAAESAPVRRIAIFNMPRGAIPRVISVTWPQILGQVSPGVEGQ